MSAFYYHLSPRSNRSSILERGLEPRSQCGRHQVVFLWHDYPTAMQVGWTAEAHAVPPADLDLWRVRAAGVYRPRHFFGMAATEGRVLSHNLRLEHSFAARAEARAQS